MRTLSHGIQRPRSLSHHKAWIRRLFRQPGRVRRTPKDLLRFITIVVAALIATSPLVYADPPYQLESFELTGTRRLDPAALASEFGLSKGTVVDDQFLNVTQRKILSLGLFRSVNFFQSKGSAPGLVHLKIQVEDDNKVLTDWALGAQAGIFYTDSNLDTLDTDSHPVNYSLTLVSRNLFTLLHRGSVFADIDSNGIFRQGRIVYGLPRAAEEDVQFDLEASVVDVRARYLSAMAYGGRAQGLWTKSTGKGDLIFGPAMYINRPRRFGFAKFPESTAGPKIGYILENRLQGFVPGPGYSFGSSVHYSVVDSDESIFELSGAYTFDLFSLARLTFDAKGMLLGTHGHSVRGETRVDVPLSSLNWRTVQTSNLFMRLRGGSDRFDDRKLTGSSATIGIQYYSPGFIADFGFEITRSPKRLFKREQDINEDWSGH